MATDVRHILIIVILLWCCHFVFSGPIGLERSMGGMASDAWDSGKSSDDVSGGFIAWIMRLIHAIAHLF